MQNPIHRKRAEKESDNQLLLFLFLFLSLSCGPGNSKDSDSIVEDTVKETQVATPDADTVNAPRVVVHENDQSLRLTAEKGKGVGPEIRYMPEWRAFGWFTAADSVVWDVDVKTPGEYNVMLEWSVSDEDAGKEFILRTRKQTLTGKVDKSGSWETYKTKQIGNVTLNEGNQKISFRSKSKFDKGALLDLREIRLVKK